MKTAAFLVIVLTFTGHAAEGPESGETFPTLALGTNVYHDARILRTTSTEAFVKFDGGIIRAKLSDLPKEIQVKYPPSSAPAPSPVKRPPRAPIMQRVSIEMAMANLETQIGNLEKAKANLQTAPPEMDGSSPGSATGASASIDLNRRLREIEANIGRMQTELNRLRIIKENARPKPPIQPLGPTNAPPVPAVSAPRNTSALPTPVPSRGVPPPNIYNTLGPPNRGRGR
jgi:hypothetical protein